MQKQSTRIKGLELSEGFYNEYGAPMINEQFPSLAGKIAIGLAGSGSECFGYDDEISQDHDFEPGFCIFIPDGLDRREEFALERAYAKLPREYMGFKRERYDPVGGNRHGIIKISEFFIEKTGTPDGDLTLRQWFSIPEQSLAEATNGKIFRDDSGIVTEIRQRLEYLPDEVRIKKLAGCLLQMGQAGQYNYGRLIKRGEIASAQLAVVEFVNYALRAIFLLNKRYIPYYKWTFRALRELELLSELHDSLYYLISSGNGEGEAAEKQNMIEQICAAVIDRLRRQCLTDFCGDQLEGHAYSVNNRITDNEIRNLHILFAV